MKSLLKVLAVGTVSALVLHMLPSHIAVGMFMFACLFAGWRLTDYP